MMSFPALVDIDGDGSDCRSESLHNRPPVRLLLEADLDHIDGAVDSEFLWRRRKAAPCPDWPALGLGSRVCDALLLGIVGLC